jgi:signal transduction histidine kinase
MFGLDPGEASGWKIDRLISVQPREEGAEFTASAGVGRHKNGRSFPIEVSRASWMDAHGRPASGAILRDVTVRDRAAAEQRRRDAADQIREKMAALGRVAGGVAHELNNLLQPVIGLAQLELEGLPEVRTADQDESHENLTAIVEGGTEMRSVVRKILMFARKAKPELTALDFPVALGHADPHIANLLSPEIRVNKIISNDAVGFACINQAELIEVLVNLATNAAYAMNNSGTLSIAVNRVDLSTTWAIPLGLVPGSYFKVAVSDTGQGVDAETKMHIMEPFFTTKPVGEGTGLGLSMIYGVMQDWNGAVTVDSTIGVGSTFTLYIPVLPNL